MAVTVGVVGCGNISRFHFAGLEKYGVKVNWVCDLSEKAAKPYADRFGARYTNDWKQVVADPATRAVLVTTVAPVHKELCLAAIDAGKAVICEKTLAMNADDALEIVRRAEAKKTLFYTSYMKRFLPVVQKAKELIPSLGRIVSTHIRAHQKWGMSWTEVPSDSWLAAKPGEKSGVMKSFGGGILVCGGSHILDLVCHFHGRPRRLFALSHTPKGTDLDAMTSILMETADGGAVHFEALAHNIAGVGFGRDGWDERMEINGERGRLEIFTGIWDMPESKPCLLVHHDGEKGIISEYCYEPESPFARALAFFLGQIEKGEQGPQSRLTGYDVDELIAHAGKSAAQRKAIDIEWRIG